MTRKPLALITFVLIAVGLAALLYWRIEQGGSPRDKRPDKPVVAEMATVRVQPMPVSLQTVGQVQPEHSVQIRPQVSGMLKAVHITEGQLVNKGQLLFRIDSAPYETTLAGARAAWVSANAQAQRLKPLVAKEYVTAQEYEIAQAQADQAEAQLKQAEINLAYTEISAPIAGRSGSLSVKAGNLVAPNDVAPLLVINQMQPILVQFTIPQQQLPDLQRYKAQRTVRIFITREDGSGDLGEGELVFIDNSINTETGTVLLKAKLLNKNEQLWPGQYVGVRIQLAMQKDALVAPLTAVQTGQKGNYVYVVKQGHAAVREVQVDRQVGDLAVIASGLNDGEMVVTRAPRNLRPGAEVKSPAAADQSQKQATP